MVGFEVTPEDKPYLDAGEDSFGSDIDYAMLVKIYGNVSEGEKRYSAAQCIGTRVEPIMGMPDPKHISTSLYRAPESHHEDGDAPIH